ncbi:MAG: MBL fold metallo-hydrolase [Bacteroidales bacterium]|nr:MBL fold metallo-hydrolase [Bacteroidales bacterium]MBR4497841.1 MBL fold metallo-hydrolase [Bacteroidales bacterium]MBR4689832.1 MBL fold metallo-hydrolase [Bacteroidales bacterium]MBR7036127.1 MBL fold metallo-hydrolase [Bacteroidales bacterium]
MKIKRFSFNPFQENTYIVYDEKSLDCAVIDPGCYFPEEQNCLLQFLQDNNLHPSKVLYTHCHLDHCFGATFLAEQFPALKFYGHTNEQENINIAEQQGAVFGIDFQQPPSISHYVFDGEKITIGNNSLTVIETPGHSAGGVCYYCENEKILFSGDTLFAGSVGRTDLFGGNMQMLIQAINTKLMTLPDDVTVYCGHGYTTTINEEKHGNPYIS